MPFPSRFVRLDEARARFGDRVDRVGAFLSRSDDLADAAVRELGARPPDAGWKLVEEALTRGVSSVPSAPPALRALFEHAEDVPPWVDWATLDRGGDVLFRAGPLGGLVLGAKSLVLGYAAPAGNKPLVFSGRLREQAARRLNETSRFVQAVCAPGGMRPLAEGWAITVKVRLMHARVRQMLVKSARWDERAWGLPINQHDMAATTLLFSISVTEGLRQLGMHVRASELDDYVQLWRWVGHVMGVDPAILPTSDAEGRRLAALIEATQGPPDDDSRSLVRALMESALEGARSPAELTAASRRMQFGYAVCRELVGNDLADRLAIERTPWRVAVGVLQRLVRATERVRVRIPAADRQAIAVGRRYWQRVVEIGLAGATAEFRPPEVLAA